MPFNYIFIGLPGAGKTTMMKTVCATLPNTPLWLMDDQIKIRLNKIADNPLAEVQLKTFATDDPIVNYFCKKWCNDFKQTKVIQALLRKGYAKHSSAIMELLGEAQWRELEAAITADFLQTKMDFGFDLGGSQPFNAQVREICRERGIKFIYLKADHETIIAHLSTPQADEKPRWQHISTYQAAGENGWRALALKHRAEREKKLEAIADITIDVSYLSVEEIMIRVKAVLMHNELSSQAAASSAKTHEKSQPPIVYRELFKLAEEQPEGPTQAQQRKKSPPHKL